jgi:hypothetical protein
VSLGLVDLFAGGRVSGRIALVDMGNRCAIDQQAEQFRPTVVAARVHEALALVDQAEVKIGNHRPFAGT